jgi:hypothetical protein
LTILKKIRPFFPLSPCLLCPFFFKKCGTEKTEEKALIIEEAWKAIASPLMAGYILYLYKTVRKFWGEVIVVTQELGDILGNPDCKRQYSG